MKNTPFWRTPHFIILAVCTLIYLGTVAVKIQGEKERNKPIKKPDSQQPESFYKVRHNLYNSNYYIDAEITKIQFDPLPNYYETKTDEYSLPKTQSAMKLTVWFKMTNPYPKPMIIPVPRYFFLQSASFNKETMSTFSRSCQCYENSGEVFTADGNDLHKSIKYSDGEYQFILNTHESKEFEVVFKYGRPDYIPVVALVGFNVSDTENEIKTQVFKIDVANQKIYVKYAIKK